jgi:hypothetical protein
MEAVVSFALAGISWELRPILANALRDQGGPESWRAPPQFRYRFSAAGAARCLRGRAVLAIFAALPLGLLTAALPSQGRSSKAA